jgi:hypothetical protein
MTVKNFLYIFINFKIIHYELIKIYLLEYIPGSSNYAQYVRT